MDRKDLDRQTREEFNRFQEGCVEENTNTEALVRRLLSDDYADKVIVTTIQKLGLALDENSKRNKQEQDLQGAARTAARQAHGLHLRRVPPLAVRRQPQGHQGVLPQGPALRLHRHAHLRGERHLPADRRRSGHAKDHARPLPEASCTPTPSPTPSRTGTSCASTSTTTSPMARTPPQAGRDARQEGRRRGHPRQARRRHRRTPVQRPPRHRVDQRRHRILRALQDPAGREAGSRRRVHAAEHRLPSSPRPPRATPT